MLRTVVKLQSETRRSFWRREIVWLILYHILPSIVWLGNIVTMQSSVLGSASCLMLPIGNLAKRYRNVWEVLGAIIFNTYALARMPRLDLNL